MSNYDYVFLVYAEFFVCITLFGLVINTVLLKFSKTLGIRDKENTMVRWNPISKPALGGITFFIAFLVSTGCYGILFDHNQLFKNGEVISMIGALCLAFVMGLADDAYNTKPWLKLFVQIACGLVLIFGSLKFENEQNFIIKIFETDVLNLLMTILWIIGIMNSINMLDNMDGITAITTIFILVTTLFFIGFENGFEHFDFLVIIGVLASLISFLFYNWTPAKIYMGDSGSQFLGLLVAILGIKYFWNSSYLSKEMLPSKQIMMVILVFILPIVDTTSVFINRISRRQSPFIGGKDHTTHHLSFLGFNNTQIIFIFSGIAFLSSLIAAILYRFVTEWTYIQVILYIVYFLGIFITLYLTTQQHKELRE